MSEAAVESVPNQYIIALKCCTPEEVFQEHIQWAQAAHSKAAAQRTESDEPMLTGVGKTFAFPDWYGYVGSFDESLKAEIEARDEVRAVHPPQREYVADSEGGIYRFPSSSRTIS